MISFSTHGEMSERFKEPVLKTGDGATHRGFESHSLRHKVPPQLGWDFFDEHWGLNVCKKCCQYVVKAYVNGKNPPMFRAMWGTFRE